MADKPDHENSEHNISLEIVNDVKDMNLHRDPGFIDGGKGLSEADLAAYQARAAEHAQQQLLQEKTELSGSGENTPSAAPASASPTQPGPNGDAEFLAMNDAAKAQRKDKWTEDEHLTLDIPSEDKQQIKAALDSYTGDPYVTEVSPQNIADDLGREKLSPAEIKYLEQEIDAFNATSERQIAFNDDLNSPAQDAYENTLSYSDDPLAPEPTGQEIAQLQQEQQQQQELAQQQQQELERQLEERRRLEEQMEQERLANEQTQQPTLMGLNV